MFYKRQKNYKAFKKNGCKHYNLLGQVFSKSTVTGHLHRASTQLPPTLDEECRNEEEFLNKGVHIATSERSETGNSKGKRVVEDDFSIGSICSKREARLEQLTVCLDKWASSLDVKMEKNMAKAKLYKSQTNEAAD